MTAPWGPTSQVAASLGWIAILALALTPAAWSAESPYRFAPFECDSGWVHEMFTKEGEDGFSVEKCVDARGRRQGVVRYWRPDGSVDGEVAYLDGQKHGASRAYDLYGFLISEEIFEDGKPTQFHYTVRGLQKIAEIANDDLRAKGKPVRMVVIDEETLQYQLVVDPSRMRRRVKSIWQTPVPAALCKLMRDLPQLSAFEARFFTITGKTVRSWTVPASRCWKMPHANQATTEPTR